ncbi:MAG: chorismate mutase [bacterium]|nr:chorismate mutase [bacterium]
MKLEELRIELDKIDDEILELLVKRFELTQQVGEFKANNKMPVVAPDREKEIFDRLRSKTASAGLEPEMTQKIWRAIIDEVVVNHKRLKADD